MSEKLSKEEVDALLDGVANGEVEGPSGAAGNAEAKPVDLLAPRQETPEKPESLELIQANLLQHLKKSLARMFGRAPALKSPAVEVVKLSDFVKRLQSPLNVHLFDLSPLPGQGLLCLSAPLAFALVDLALGGQGVEAKTEEREYSATENRLLRRTAADLLRDVERAWEPLVKIECRYAGLEPSAARLGRLGDGFVAPVQIEVELGETPLTMEICLPFAALKSANQQFSGGAPDRTEKSGEWLADLQTSLIETEVTLAAELGSAVVPVARILSLKVGDTLMLGTGRTQTIRVRVEGVEKFTGVPGVVNGSNAVRINEQAD